MLNQHIQQLGQLEGCMQRQAVLLQVRLPALLAVNEHHHIGHLQTLDLHNREKACCVRHFLFASLRTALLFVGLHQHSRTKPLLVYPCSDLEQRGCLIHRCSDAWSLGTHPCLRCMVSRHPPLPQMHGL